MVADRVMREFTVIADVDTDNPTQNNFKAKI